MIKFAKLDGRWLIRSDQPLKLGQVTSVTRGSGERVAVVIGPRLYVGENTELYAFVNATAADLALASRQSKVKKRRAASAPLPVTPVPAPRKRIVRRKSVSQ